jgi:hypothetical protein
MELKDYNQAMSAVNWRQTHKLGLITFLNVMINLNITSHIQPFLESMKPIEMVGFLVALITLNAGVFYFLRRFLRVRREERLRKRLVRMQIWQVVKADRQIQKRKVEREKVFLGRQDI